jgi:hypothetical protein
MNVKRYVISTLAVFVFIFIYQMIVHGFLLSGMYQATSHVWRMHVEMKSHMGLSTLSQLATSAWLAFVFTRFYKTGSVENGLRFGLYFGIFAAIMMSSWYLYLPVHGALGISWFFCGLGEGLGAGLILGMVYRK